MFVGFENFRKLPVNVISYEKQILLDNMVVLVIISK